MSQLQGKKETFHKTYRVLKALFFAVRYPSLIKPIAKPSVTSLYAAGVYRSSSLEKIAFEKVLCKKEAISLENCYTRDGNVSYLELIVLCNILKITLPKNLLEIGTFDGNTTLQMALNTSEEALIHTIDLPGSADKTTLPILQREVKFVMDTKKQTRKYEESSQKHKIKQHLGDSTLYDFSRFCERGLLDFCFIDGSHSYESVQSDTEKTLENLSSKGTILWHDFDPNYPGVYGYLNGLSSKVKLYHIEKTSFALHTNHPLLKSIL